MKEKGGGIFSVPIQREPGKNKGGRVHGGEGGAQEGASVLCIEERARIQCRWGGKGWQKKTIGKKGMRNLVFLFLGGEVKKKKRGVIE